MPERVIKERSTYRTEKRRTKKRGNPNFLSDDNLDTGRDSLTSEYSTTSYCSTCTQTSDASTNTIDSNLRVIRRPALHPRRLPVTSETRGRALYRVPVRQENGTTRYILRRDQSNNRTLEMRGNERVILRRRANSVDATGRVLVRRSDSRERIIRERPSSYHSDGGRIVERRILRTVKSNENTKEIPVRRQIIKKVEQPREPERIIERRIVRRSVKPETQPVKVVSKTERTVEQNPTVVRRIVTRQPSNVSHQYVVPVREREIIRRPRPSSYDGRVVEAAPQYVERRVRPSSYHHGMEREYIAIRRPESDEESTTATEDDVSVVEKEDTSYWEKVPRQSSSTQVKAQIEHHRVKETVQPTPVQEPHQPPPPTRERVQQTSPPREKIQQENQTTEKDIKRYNTEKWVDEYDVPDKETRDVGVQMTTHYKLPDPPKKETRNVGIQTKPPKKKVKKVQTDAEPEPKPEPEPEPEPKPKYIFVKKPKMKSQYVRVGGGWMKIDHYRNHHIPLKIFEHNRAAKDAKKYLSIKYRYTKDRKKTPIAWSKYRSTVAKDS